MSDLTRGNLVFGSLNSKRSRVSLARRGEAGTVRGAAAKGERGGRGEARRGGTTRWLAYCVCGLWSQRGAREEREEGENERQRQLDSARGVACGTRGRVGGDGGVTGERR